MPPPAGREMPPRKRELPGLGAGASEFHPPSPRNWSLLSASGQGSRRGGESTGGGEGGVAIQHTALMTCSRGN